MKKIILLLFLSSSLLFAGGSQESTSALSVKSDSNILIAYFTWAENTNISDEEASLSSELAHLRAMGDKVDSISSASVVLPGNVAKMARQIQSFTRGDLYSIQVEDAYPSIYDECLDRASEEKSQSARPALKGSIDITAYEIIFLGFPNWWYTAPMAIFSFLESNDFSGKTIVPFISHGSGGIASSVRDISRVLPENVMISEPLGIHRDEIENSETIINTWLKSLGFEEAEETTMKINLTDNELSKELESYLPLTLSFSDFNNTEKIAYLPDSINLELSKGEGGHAPKIGDICIYGPWGNLCIFYKDYHYSEDLYYLGTIDNIESYLAESSFDATLTTGN